MPMAKPEMFRLLRTHSMWTGAAVVVVVNVTVIEHVINIVNESLALLNMNAIQC